MQVFSRTISLGHRVTNRSRSRARRGSKIVDDDDPEITGLRRPGDYKTKQVFTGTKLFFLAYQSIGTLPGRKSLWAISNSC
jgi:KUP system potassium uptake protein